MLRFSFKEYDVPPDRLRFKAPDGHTIEATDRRTWYAKIRRHYQDNSIPIPSDIEQIAQDQLCRILPPGWCVHENGVGSVGVNTRLSLGDYLHGMRMLSEIAVSSDPLVDEDTAIARGNKCAACPANVPVAGCAPCVRISNLIVGIKGSKDTPADPFLKTCSICKCNTQAKIWVKTELLAKATDATALAQLRTMPDCWLPRELDNLYNKP